MNKIFLSLIFLLIGMSFSFITLFIVTRTHMDLVDLNDIKRSLPSFGIFVCLVLLIPIVVKVYKQRSIWHLSDANVGLLIISSGALLSFVSYLVESRLNIVLLKNHPEIYYIKYVDFRK